MASKYSTNIQTQYTKDFVGETISITGSLCSGTYAEPTSTLSNCKDEAQGYYQKVYDFPYLSQSANPLFDITWGYRPDSDGHTLYLDRGHGPTTAPTVGATSDTLAKQNIYKQMSALMLGYTQTGSLRIFDVSGNFNSVNNETVMDSPVFISFSRLAIKDEIKKGSFEFTIGTGSYDQTIYSGTVAEISHKITDSGSSDIENGLRILKVIRTDTDTDTILAEENCGILDRFRGIAAIQLSSSVVTSLFDDGDASFFFAATTTDTNSNFRNSMISSSITDLCDGLRARIINISLKNLTQLNIQNYMCAIGAAEFNYSSNPSYVNTASQIQVRLDSDGSINKNNPAYTYATGIGLYSADNELMASGKFSKPIKLDGSKPRLIVGKMTT